MSEPMSEPVAEAMSEPVAEAMSERVAETTSEPVAEPTSEPVAEAMSELVAEPTSERVVELVAVGPPRKGGHLSVAEAALVSGRHEATVRRYLRSERLPNAYRGQDDAWHIPVSDLVDAGLLPRSAQDQGQGPEAEAEEEIARLLVENGELHRRLAVAESLAAERADRIRQIELSLRLLGTTPREEHPTRRDQELPAFVWSGEIVLDEQVDLASS